MMAKRLTPERAERLRVATAQSVMDPSAGCRRWRAGAFASAGAGGGVVRNAGERQTEAQGGRDRAVRGDRERGGAAAMKALHKSEIDRMLERRGRRTPTTLHAIASRGYLLRMGAKQFFPAMSERQQVEQLRKVMVRYEAGRWRRDRNETSCPEAIRGTVHEIAFLILRQQDRAPGFSTIRNALRRIR